MTQDFKIEKELLAVSFGTSYPDSRRLTIGAIEERLAQAFPDFEVRRAFTSQMIIERIKEKEGEAIDNVREALNRAVKAGVKQLVIQPTHVLNGLEYQDLVKEAASYENAFEGISIGAPLLTDEADYRRVMEAVVNAMKIYDDGETALCLMGHGTEAESNSAYRKMQEMFRQSGYHNYWIGTVEASPDLQDVLKAVKKGGYRKAVLRPFMIVAGDHANNDMAGDDEDSWKSVFETAGLQVTAIVEGLGQLPAIREIFVDHGQAAEEKLLYRKKNKE